MASISLKVVLAAIKTPKRRRTLSGIAAAVLCFHLKLEGLLLLIVGSLGLPCLMPD